MINNQPSTMMYAAFLLLLGGVLCSTKDVAAADSLTATNGIYTSITKYPWTASFLVENNIWGAGAIMDKNWILTSAFNCLWVAPSYITVRVGSDTWTENGTLYSVEKCIIHENYTGFWGYNIALLKVKGNMTLGTSTTRRILTPTRNRTNVEGTTLSVAGWGVRSNVYEKETQIQYSNQTVLNDTECQAYYNLTDNTAFCAHNSVSSPCIFDFGDPLVTYAASLANQRVFGLYLGSTNCSDPATYPALYVDVFQFKAWINSTMANN